MSDLVERLRTLVILDEVRSDNPLGREAAARIEALEAEVQSYAIRLSQKDVVIEKLEVALREIAYATEGRCGPTLGESIKIARAALAPEQKP